MVSSNDEGHKDKEWYKDDNGLFLPETYHAAIKKKKMTAKQKVSWIFNNITVVLLLPSFLGAVWQVLELSSINVAYIRFFSLSQIPVDGILVLFFIVLIASIGKGLTSLAKANFKKKIKLLENEELIEKISKKLRFYIIRSVVTSIVLVLALIYIIIELFVVIFPGAPIVTLLILSLLISGLIFYITDTILLIVLKIHKDDPSVDYTNNYIATIFDRYGNAIYYSALAGVVVALYIVYILLKGFSASFILPINLYNTKNLESVIYSEFQTKDYSIKYFNDKYIFVELCPIKKCSYKLDKKIAIYPTEKVLFKTTYGKVWTGYFTTNKPVES